MEQGEEAIPSALGLKAEEDAFWGKCSQVFVCLFCLDVADSVVAAAFGSFLVNLPGFSLLLLGGLLIRE